MIVYFSGTGNSLSIAIKLADILGDKAVHINKVLSAGKIKDKTLGFVYPTYFNDMPVFVRESIKKLDLGEVEYIFAIANHGGDPGNALYTAKKVIQDKGKELSFGAEMIMPVNSRIAYGRAVGRTINRLEKEVYIIDDIAKKVRIRKENGEEIKEKKIASFVAKLADAKWVKKYSKKNVDHKLCVKCQTCVQICPVGNISFSDNKIVIGDKCVECYACIHWCPKAAIGFRKNKTKKENQYHHPDVKVSEMIEGAQNK